MTLEEMQEKWAGWTVQAFKSSLYSRRWYAVAGHQDDENRLGTYEGKYCPTRRASLDDLDAWMTMHLKRPRARKGAKRANKGGR